MTPCTEGFMCPKKGLAAAGDACTAGKYCPEQSIQGDNCDPGHFCVAGVAEQERCPVGTYLSTCCAKS